jgi:glycosyltransferase involved in cell wall biosynthesis
MPSVLVLSYLDLSENTAGAPRRTNALIRAIPGTPLLVQPRRHHPEVLTAPFPVDLGRRKVGINWGIFNLQWPGNAKVVHAVVENQVPLMIICGSIWTVLAAGRYRDIPILLDAHNVDAAYMEQQYGRGHPLARTVERLERNALRCVRHIFACSTTDRAGFMDRYGIEAERISVVPNGVDAAAFGGPAPPAPPDTFWGERIGDAATVLFMGKLDYGPNREALEFIRSELVPAVRASGLQAKTLIVGGPIPEGRFPDDMVFTGRLPTERLIAYLKSANVCIAPVFSGSGTRLKVIETLAAGRAMVSTFKGAEGLGLASGRHARLAEKDEFADAVVDLLRDPSAAERMGRCGQRFVAETYDFQRVIVPKWREVFLQYVPSSDGLPAPPAAVE